MAYMINLGESCTQILHCQWPPTSLTKMQVCNYRIVADSVKLSQYHYWLWHPQKNNILKGNCIPLFPSHLLTSMYQLWIIKQLACSHYGSQWPLLPKNAIKILPTMVNLILSDLVSFTFTYINEKIGHNQHFFFLKFLFPSNQLIGNLSNLKSIIIVVNHKSTLGQPREQLVVSDGLGTWFTTLTALVAFIDHKR